MLPLRNNNPKANYFTIQLSRVGKFSYRKKKRGRRRKQLLDDVKEKIRYWNLTGSTKSHSVEKSIWKKLWSCRKTNNEMDYCMVVLLYVASDETAG